MQIELVALEASRGETILDINVLQSDGLKLGIQSHSNNANHDALRLLPLEGLLDSQEHSQAMKVGFYNSLNKGQNCWAYVLIFCSEAMKQIQLQRFERIQQIKSCSLSTSKIPSKRYVWIYEMKNFWCRQWDFSLFLRAKAWKLKHVVKHKACKLVGVGK